MKPRFSYIKIIVKPAILLSFFSFRIFAAPQETKIIQSDTTWQGQVLLNGTVVVNSHVTLTILPGTKVKFKNYRGYREPNKRLSLIVNGKILAQGTASQPIYFTSDTSKPQNGDWSMVRLISNVKQSVFKYCVFEFAQHGLNVWNSSPIISNCVFRWCNWEGVYFESYSQPTLKYVQIYQNGYNGLASEQSNTVLMDSCDVWKNGTNGVHTDNSNTEIRRSLIHKNGANGLSADDNATLKVFGVASYNNNSYGLLTGEGSFLVQVGNFLSKNNVIGKISGNVDSVATSYAIPSNINIGYTADSSYALGYTPGDLVKDKYMYVYPDDETRKILKKVGTGLGLTWALGWDGQNLWTCTLWNHIYKIDPQTGTVLDDFLINNSQQWGSPTQPWGLTIDDEKYIWIVDFANRKLYKIDPLTHNILFSFDSPKPNLGGCKGLEWDGQYLNVMGWAEQEIYQMNKNGNLINTITLSEKAGGGLTFDGTYFWAPQGSSRISKFDKTGKLIGWIYPASEGTWDLTWDGHYLWASQRTNENWQDAKIFQLQILDDHTQLTNVKNEKTLPTKFSLEQNYPNPFNPSTTISYRLPQATYVSLKIFDTNGREVATLVNEYKQAGSYKVVFDVRTTRELSLPSGVYFYTIRAGSFADTKKLVLIK